MAKKLIRTRFGDVTYKPEDIETFGKFTPTDVSKIVNISLMTKPQKSVVFKSFVNKVDAKTGFVTYFIDQMNDATPKDFNLIIDACTGKIKAAEEFEKAKLEEERLNNIKHLEMVIAESQKELNLLKSGDKLGKALDDFNKKK